MASSDENDEEKQKQADKEQERVDINQFPSRSELYDTQTIIKNLEQYPIVAVRRSGKYYLNMKSNLVESNRVVWKNPRTGKVKRKYEVEKLEPVEYVVSRFCEDVLSISRSTFLPLSSQGERHIIWVSKKRASHIIRRLNGNGCYVVNRFPGDIFLKDKQVMGIVLSQFMMMRSNTCRHECGKDRSKEAGTRDSDVTYRPCEHMVKAMDTSCSELAVCEAANRRCCKHLEFFIPEVQSFCTYNALQNFSNRLREDLKGQVFVCKPAYFTRGNGIRFLHNEEEFKEFYHMTEGKETSRHDFMVQRLVSSPLLYNGYKFDIRAFLLVIVLRFRRVVSFVHYGFCRRAAQKYDNNIPCCTGQQAAAKSEAKDGAVDLRMKAKNAFPLRRHQEAIVCTYGGENVGGKLLKGESDRSMTLETVFVVKNEKKSSDEDQDLDDGNGTVAREETKNEDIQLLESVKQQIKFIAKRITETIENKVWDWFGCFQIFSMDLCVQDRGEDKGEVRGEGQKTKDQGKGQKKKDRFKVWLLEVNSHALSQVDKASDTQRKMIPAILSEAIGLVAECQYKSFHNMRLRSDPLDAAVKVDLFFLQNYDCVYDTPIKKRMDYKPPKPKPSRKLPYVRRIDVVDQQMKAARARKLLQERQVKEVAGEQDTAAAAESSDKAAAGEKKSSENAAAGGNKSPENDQ